MTQFTLLKPFKNTNYIVLSGVFRKDTTANASATPFNVKKVSKTTVEFSQYGNEGKFIGNWYACGY